MERPSTYDMGLVTRKATYKQYAQAIPGSFAIEKLDKAPCRMACPAHLNVQGYVQMVKVGKYREAIEIIMRDLPFPGVLGRVCPHRCEKSCRRMEVDSPISIRELKRVAADHVDLKDLPVPAITPRNKGVAIVGSGPAGLTAAYFLALDGYKVSVYEAMPKAGGMMRYGIPSHRLPRSVLDAEIENLERFGITIHTNSPIGKNLTLEDLRSHGAEAVFLATGAWKGITLRLPGEDHPDVIHITRLIQDMELGRRTSLKGRVLVFGAGHSGIDAIRTAIRLGAEKVQAVEPFSMAQMPAPEEDFKEIEEEGARLYFQSVAKRIVIEKGKVAGVECIRTRLTDPDSTGRRKFIPIAGSEFFIEADVVISAVGQEPDLSFLGDAHGGLTVSKWGHLVVNAETLQTNIPHVFAGGDAITGAATVIEAVEAGKRAAYYMGRYLRGEELPLEWEEEPPMGERWTDIPKTCTPRERLSVPTLPVEERVASFAEVRTSVSEEAAQAEAGRCLNCGGCCECFQCVTACKAQAVTLETHAQRPEQVSLKVGAVILAPGFQAFDPKDYDTYRYAAFPDVVTSMEFERILSSTGPYHGHLKRPSDGREPRKIAWLQCVGSRDINRCDNGYCSSVCCMYATKEAVIAKEHAEHPLETAIFFMDMRTYGKDFERYYTRAEQEHGVRYIRARIHSIEEEKGDLVLQYADEAGEPKEEHFDMVVLSVGMETPGSVVELAERLDIALDSDRFVEAGAFSPVETSRKGVYVCGAFQEPKDIPYSVMEASAAACEAKGILASARGTEVKERHYPKERDVSVQGPAIGVFVCNCGTNIGGIVDVPKVADYARTLPGVVYVEDNLFTCSQDTQDKMRQVIEEKGINRVVVAACTPRTHEALFQETLRDAGLNKYLFEMANIRNHCSWVHAKEREKATEKAMDLVRMAVARAGLIQSLPQPTIPVNHEALVIGGGVAGMTAALGLADQGFKTTLAERRDVLGGTARDLLATYKGEEVAPELEAMLARVKDHPKIEVLTGAELVGGTGFVGNFETTLRVGGGKERVIRHGAVVVATGAQEYRPVEYLYGEDARVLTHLDLDRAMKAGDPRVRAARSVAFIQCVGSREPGRPYCSKVCCTHTMKSAIHLKEEAPEREIVVLYRDMRTYGQREALYREARRRGVLFVRYDLERRPRVVREGESLSVLVQDPILGRPIRFTPDLLVLASGIVPQDNQALAQIFKLPLNEDGFFMEAHAKLRPVEFATEGVFLAGMAHYPKPLEESVSQAKAAASRASVVLSKDQLTVEGAVSHVNETYCQGCGECVAACPYSAIALVSLDGGRRVARVQAALCKGCGACAVACPAGAAALYHYGDEVVLSMVEAALEA